MVLSIKVYTTELEYIRVVSRQEGTQTFNRISSGNLYVSVIDKTPCIQVLSNRGKVLHSFGEKKLREPYGVCLTDEYIHVANKGKHNYRSIHHQGGSRDLIWTVG